MIPALAALLGACASQPPPGLSVKRVAANIAFGVEPAGEAVAPAGVTPPQSPEQEEEFQPNLPPPTAASPAAAARCRQAGPNDFPQEDAPLGVSGRPKQGVFSWKQSGYNQPTGVPIRAALPEFVERAVQEVKPDPADPGNFTFQTTEKDPSLFSRMYVTLTFRVDQTNPNTRERGVFLTRITNDPRDGRTRPRTFNPSPPVLFLPIPVVAGQESAWRSVAVDTSTLQTMTHEGYVKSRHRVDACGTVIDSWFVDAVQTVTTSEGTSRRNYNYAIATQFGGLIVFEHSESPCAQSSEDRCEPPGQLLYDTNIAQTEPDSKRKDIN